MEDIKIYDSWGKLNVRQYDEIVRIQNAHPNDSAKYIVEYLYDVDNADNMPLHEYGCYVAGLRSFLAEPINKARLTPNAEYVVHGRTYRVDITPSAFSVAQYIDFTNYTQRHASLADLLSVVIIPDGKMYNDGYDMQQAKDDIGDMPLEAGFAVLGFFGRWSKASIRTFLRSLTKKMRKNGKVAPETMTRLEKEVGTLLQSLESFPM